mgnify:CR=1 FL=1
MIAVPGDTSAQTLSAIIADEAAIGMVNSKTTAVRLIPAPGKKVGDMVEFGGLLGSALYSPSTPSPPRPLWTAAAHPCSHAEPQELTSFLERKLGKNFLQTAFLLRWFCSATPGKSRYKRQTAAWERRVLPRRHSLFFTRIFSCFMIHRLMSTTTYAHDNNRRTNRISTPAPACPQSSFRTNRPPGTAAEKWWSQW